MTKGEARVHIIAEWQEWTNRHKVVAANGVRGLMFFGYLQRERPHLLAFTSSGDNWQVVHGWLLKAGFVSD